MTTLRPRPRLLHTIVAMGVALTGGASAACGGIATEILPPASDAGGDEMDAGDATDDAYPIIDAARDQYATIGYVGRDADRDGYSTIRPVEDAYPTIGADVGADSYPTIGIGADAGEADGYPIIH